MKLGRHSIPRWVLALVVLQVSVPAGVLVLGDPPDRYGYQMYSARGGFEVTAHDAEGREVTIPDDVFAQPRPEIDWARHLPPHLCNHMPAVHTVTVETASGKEVVSC